MKKQKLYFSSLYSEERCFELQDHIDYMLDEGLNELELTEAEKDTSSGYGWCGDVEDFLDLSDNPCGKHCTSYKPINGRNGKCRWKGDCYEPGNVKITIYRKDYE